MSTFAFLLAFGLNFASVPSTCLDVAAAPIESKQQSTLRVVDYRTGKGIPGAKVLSLDEKDELLLGMTDAEGSVTFDRERCGDLIRVEAAGYHLYMLDPAQLSNRSVISLKPDHEDLGC